MLVTPRDLDERLVSRLLREAAREKSLPRRMKRISGLLLGRPYVANPLIGGADVPEVFTVSMDGFDCVTFVETVLALALSRETTDFPDFMQRIRYERAIVDWKHRNHYMTGWIQSNVRSGLLENLTDHMVPVHRHRLLSVLNGLPAKAIDMRCIPKARFQRHLRDIRDGDLVFFASTRRNLDVYHCGLLVLDDDTVMLRHASRKGGAVVEEPIEAFLRKNRMAGCILVRPLAEPEEDRA